MLTHVRWNADLMITICTVNRRKVINWLSYIHSIATWSHSVLSCLPSIQQELGVCWEAFWKLRNLCCNLLSSRNQIISRLCVQSTWIVRTHPYSAAVWKTASSYRIQAQMRMWEEPVNKEWYLKYLNHMPILVRQAMSLQMSCYDLDIYWYIPSPIPAVKQLRSQPVDKGKDCSIFVKYTLLPPRWE